MVKSITAEELSAKLFTLRLPKAQVGTYTAPKGLPKPPKPQKIKTSDIPSIFSMLSTHKDLTIDEAISLGWLVYHFVKNKRRWNLKEMFPKLEVGNLKIMATLFSVQPTTLRTYAYAYTLCLRYVRATFPRLKSLRDLQETHIMAFIWDSAYRGLAPSTISTRLTGVKFFCKLWKMDENPANTQNVELSMRAISKLCAKKVKKAFPLRLRHIARFVKKMNWNEAKDVRDAYLAFCLSAGWLRVSELTNLKWDNLIFEHLKASSYGPAGTFIQIIELETTKTKIAGDVVVIASPPHFPTIDLKKLIRSYTQFFPDEADESPYVFRSPADPSKQMTPACVRSIIKRLGRRVGEPNWKLLTSHSGRVGGVTDAAAAGIPEAFIRWYGRWDSAVFYGYFQDAAFAGVRTTLRIADYTMKLEGG